MHKVGGEKGFRFTIMFAYIDEGGNLNPPKVILSNKKIPFTFSVEPLGEIPLSVLIKYLAMKILLWKICGYPDYTKTLKFEIKE